MVAIAILCTVVLWQTWELSSDSCHNFPTHVVDGLLTFLACVGGTCAASFTAGTMNGCQAHAVKDYQACSV